MHKIYPFFLAFVFTSCISTGMRYLGQSYTPTEKVDVFVNRESIRREFDFIGKGYLSSYGFFNVEWIQGEAIKLAKKKGADAVLITDHLVPVQGVVSQFVTDSIGRSSITTGTATVTNGTRTQFQIHFLKYRSTGQ